MKKILFLITLLSPAVFSQTLEHGQRFDDWTVRCINLQTEKRETQNSEKQQCFIEQNLVYGKGDKKRRLLGVQIGYYQQRKIANLTLPLGMLLKHGVSLGIDNFKFSKKVAYTYCDLDGCSASFELDSNTVDLLKKANTLKVNAVDLSGKNRQVGVSLKGFTPAFEALILSN